MEFEWDAAKSASNEEKHRIALEAACALWDGLVLEFISPYPLEERKLAIGKIAGKFWTVIFTHRDEKIRLISARRSRADEKKAYDEKYNRRKS